MFCVWAPARTWPDLVCRFFHLARLISTILMNLDYIPWSTTSSGFGEAWYFAGCLLASAWRAGVRSQKP